MTTTTKVTLAAFRAAKVKRQYCQLGPEIATLSPAEQRDYQAGMADRSISAAAIVTVLRGRGLNISRHALEKHRRGLCSNCFGVPQG